MEEVVCVSLMQWMKSNGGPMIGWGKWRGDVDNMGKSQWWLEHGSNGTDCGGGSNGDEQPQYNNEVEFLDGLVGEWVEHLKRVGLLGQTA